MFNTSNAANKAQMACIPRPNCIDSGHGLPRGRQLRPASMALPNDYSQAKAPRQTKQKTGVFAPQSNEKSIEGQRNYG